MGEEELTHDVGDIFYVDSPNQEYQGVILIDDTHYLGTVNNVVDDVATLIPKITFTCIPDWKAFVRLSIYVRSGNGRHGLTNEIRDPTDLHQAHIYMGRGCISTIEAHAVNETTVGPNLEPERLLQNGLTTGLVYELTITYVPDQLRQHGFMAPATGERIYPELDQIHDLLYSPTRPVIRMLINTNELIHDVITTFEQQLASTSPDYPSFYPKHPERHFLQSGDYPAPEDRPSVYIPATTTFDD